MIALVPLLALAPTFPFYVLLHESAHAGAALMQGYEVKEFKPYPHFGKDKNYFGSMTYVTPDDVEHGKDDLPTIMAPYMLDAAIFLATDAFVNSEYAEKNFTLMQRRVIKTIGMVAPMINTSWALARHNNSDFAVISTQGKLLAASGVLIGGIRLVTDW